VEARSFSGWVGFRLPKVRKKWEKGVGIDLVVKKVGGEGGLE